MKDIRDYLSNYTAASSGFSLGRLKDDPGDGTGSGITVATHNDFLYGFYASVLKYLGAVSETDESETASDMLTAIERAAGVANENVTAWSNSTTYAQDDHVMYLGLQYVSMAAANVGNNPFDTPLKWLPCFGRDEAMRAYRDGHDLPGGFAPLHNKRDATYYRDYFKWGKYNFGGNAGRNFQAYGFHLDGQVITGNATYEALFAVGLAGEYHLLDIIAPDVLGTRTVLDTKGRAPRVVDATSGSAVDVGLAQDDQMQGHIHHQGGGDSYSAFAQFGEFSRSATNSAGSGGAYSNAYGYKTSTEKTDGTNGTPRTGAETRMKNYSVGIRSILLLVEI